MKETHVFMGFKIRFCVIKIQEIDRQLIKLKIQIAGCQSDSDLRWLSIVS